MSQRVPGNLDLDWTHSAGWREMLYIKTSVTCEGHRIADSLSKDLESNPPLPPVHNQSSATGSSMPSLDMPLQVVLPGEAVLSAAESITAAPMWAIQTLPAMLAVMAGKVLVQ